MRPSPGGREPYTPATCARNAPMPRTFAPMTNAATTAAPRKNTPTSAKPPKAKTTPPTEAPVLAPSWLLVANIPLAVARDSPASSAVIERIGAQDMPDARAAADHRKPLQFPLTSGLQGVPLEP